MKSKKYQPSASLRPFIHSYWTIETGEHETGQFRFAPDGYPELLFNLEQQALFTFGGNRTQYACAYGVLGQFFYHSNLNISKHRMTFFVKLQPAGLFALFQDNISAFSNGISEVPELKNLHGELCSTFQSFQEIKQLITITESWLHQQLKPYPHFTMVQHILQQIERNYKGNVQNTLEGYGVSPRRIQQIFKERVGLSPKQYQRLIRFRKAMKQLKQSQQQNDFIRSLGYYDWSHFSKDMHYYLECSPGDFIARVHRGHLLTNLRN